MRRLAAAFAAAGAILALSAGCSASAPDVASPVPAPSAVAAPAVPVSLTYDRIGVQQVAMRGTGLDARKALATPDVTDPTPVWLRWSPRLAPGRPLVVAAHVNIRSPGGSAVPGVFARLTQAKAGDSVSVTDSAGQTREYTVRSVQRVDKDEFPSSVYDARPVPTLLLVTCTGDLETLPDGRRSFDGNEIVTAEAAS